MNKRTIYQDTEATRKKNRSHKKLCSEINQVKRPKKEVSK